MTFHLEGLAPEDYEAHCEQIAERFLTWPGLVAKVWLADRERNTYGGVYLFASKEDADRSRSTPEFAGMMGNPAFADVRIVEHPTLDGPTRVTTAARHRPF